LCGAAQLVLHCIKPYFFPKNNTLDPARLPPLPFLEKAPRLRHEQG
jgi:hypothetical protein